MISKIKKIISLVMTLSIVILSLAQQSQKEIPEKYAVVNWNTEQGFPSKFTNCILKDVNGFLWIGTRTGLSRFDGSTFKNYFPGIGKTTTIPGGNIIGLKEDSLHNIWIGTNNGISRYDIKADTFTNILSVINVANANTYIIPFWATSDEVLCLEADSIFTAYDIHLLKKRIIVSLPQKIGDNRAVPFSVFEAQTNSVWMQPANGALAAASGLFQVSLTNGKPVLFDWPCYKNIPHHYHFTEGICYDRKRNSIWMNNNDGLIEFSLANRQFRYIDAVKNLHNRGVGMSIDTKERIWIGTGDKGILIYDPATLSVTRPFSYDSVLSQTVNFTNYRIYCDRDGMIWIGYWIQFGKGINQLVPVSPTVITYPINKEQPGFFNVDRPVTSLKTHDGQMWICGDNRMNMFDPKTGLFRLIDKKDLKGIDTKKEVAFLGVDSNAEKAWICVYPPDSLYEMDISSLHCRPMKTKDIADKEFNLETINNEIVRPFKNGYIFWGAGLQIAAPGIFALEKNNAAAHQLLVLGNERITDMSTDKEQMIFLRVDGSANLSYSLINGKWVQVHTPLDSIPWIGIYYNKADMTWWAGAFMQMVHYDKNFRLIRRYTIEDGVPDMQVYSMLADNRGNIWFQGSSGFISQLNLKTGVITSLSEKDGFQKLPVYPKYSCQKDDGGDLYFGGYDGIDRIKPANYVFTEASVYLKSLQIKEFSLPHSTSVNTVEELSLKYFQNRISIETGTIDYYSKGKSHVRYKLEGRDKDWQYAPANYTIRYEELPPEKYTLQLQAGNAGNEFTGPIRTLIINISPAFWNTWWFRIAAIFCLVISIYSLIRWRMKQKYLRQLEISEKERQLAEIKQKATELEMQALRAQMNPHFIFNSLNSINRFILQNNREQASEFLTKFSKLVRMILQNSQASSITLDSELESLGLYLNLEALRFNYHFDYKISVPKDMDISAIQVPPLILQPYVENAIWHGLMHKEEKGQLDINVSEEDDHVYFKVTDNGIGRKRASELSSKSATKHKSMGLKITAHRIAMMQNSNGLESPVKINDLVNPDGTAVGTEVIIKMPVIYD
jgi:ligand-binding sensor domain-containing protein